MREKGSEKRKKKERTREKNDAFFLLSNRSSCVTASFKHSMRRSSMKHEACLEKDIQRNGDAGQRRTSTSRFFFFFFFASRRIGDRSTFFFSRRRRRRQRRRLLSLFYEFGPSRRAVSNSQLLSWPVKKPRTIA